MESWQELQSFFVGEQIKYKSFIKEILGRWEIPAWKCIAWCSAQGIVFTLLVLNMIHNWHFYSSMTVSVVMLWLLSMIGTIDSVNAKRHWLIRNFTSVGCLITGIALLNLFLSLNAIHSVSRFDFQDIQPYWVKISYSIGVVTYILSYMSMILEYRPAKEYVFMFVIASLVWFMV